MEWNAKSEYNSIYFGKMVMKSTLVVASQFSKLFMIILISGGYHVSFTSLIRTLEGQENVT